jgi:hypothetical protein
VQHALEEEAAVAGRVVRIEIHRGVSGLR